MHLDVNDAEGIVRHEPEGARWLETPMLKDVRDQLGDRHPDVSGYRGIEVPWIQGVIESASSHREGVCRHGEADIESQPEGLPSGTGS
jgi:hypothetical protein